MTFEVANKGGEKRLELNERQRKIFRVVKEQEPITGEQIAEWTGHEDKHYEGHYRINRRK